jgi:hypothetical protein
VTNYGGSADQIQVTVTVTAPRARSFASILVSQNNASTGFIEANNVNIVFNNFSIVGDGPVVAGTGDGLTG